MSGLARIQREEQNVLARVSQWTECSLLSVGRTDRGDQEEKEIAIGRSPDMLRAAARSRPATILHAGITPHAD